MTASKLAILNFNVPYHVGWRRAEPIIEGLTIHRALIGASVILEGSDSMIDKLLKLSVSAALPAIPTDNLYKILLPLPPIPSRVALKKLGIKWVTMRASLEIARRLQRGVYPIITDVMGANVVVRAGIEEFKLCKHGGVISLCEEPLDPVPEGELLEPVHRYVNRMDRATNAADVFKITGYVPRVALGIILQGEEDAIDYALKLFKLLGELGLGGLRSRGLGKFTVKEGGLYDSELIKHRDGPRFFVVLGSCALEPPVDSRRSLVILRTISGYSGPSYDAYILPELSYAGAGSIVFYHKSLNVTLKRIKTSHMGAYLIFNPVVAGVGR